MRLALEKRRITADGEAHSMAGWHFFVHPGSLVVILHRHYEMTHMTLILTSKYI